MSILGKQNSSLSSCWILFPFIINVSVTCEDITEGKIWFVRRTSCLSVFSPICFFIFYFCFIFVLFFSVVLFSSSSSFCFSLFFFFSLFLYIFSFFLYSNCLFSFLSSCLVIMRCVCVQSSPQRYMSRGRLILARCKLLLDPKRLHWLRTRCLQGEKISAGPITFPKTCLHLWTQKVREGASVFVGGREGSGWRAAV